MTTNNNKENYVVDVLAIENWQTYFINKVYNKVLRTIPLENVAKVAIQMKGDITDFKVEEYQERGGFVYALVDAVLKTTLDVVVFTKQRAIVQHVIEIELPVKTDRKRSPQGLSENMVSEILRFKKAFEQAGKNPHDFKGKPTKNLEDLTVYFGQAGYQLFMQHVGQLKQKPVTTLDALIQQYTQDAVAQHNERGQRIVKRFLDTETLKLLQLPTPRIVNQVPIFTLKTKAMELHIAPTFAILSKADNVQVLYNIDKGNSVLDALKVLTHLQVKQAQQIAYLMDLRRQA